MTCPFCNVVQPEFASALFLGVKDLYPVNPGHVLVVSKRHVSSLFDLSADEWQDLGRALLEARRRIGAETGATAFNIGANVGTVAGQTVDHFHMHVIPRYEGDVSNPRGGVRNIKPPVVPY